MSAGAVPGPDNSTEPRAERGWAVAVLLALAAVVTALIGGRAALLGDSGADELNVALREDVRSGARIVGDVRILYEEDASVAHRIAEAELISQEMAAAARREGGNNAAILEAESEAYGTLAEVLSTSAVLTDGEPDRAIAAGGEELLARLAEIRAERSDELKALDPDARQQTAERRAADAALLTAAVIPVAVAFLLGALAEVVPRRRSLLLGSGYLAVAVGVLGAVAIEVLR